jgi:hypothetical protein
MPYCFAIPLALPLTRQVRLDQSQLELRAVPPMPTHTHADLRTTWRTKVNPSALPVQLQGFTPTDVQYSTATYMRAVPSGRQCVGREATATIGERKAWDSLKMRVKPRGPTDGRACAAQTTRRIANAPPNDSHGGVWLRTGTRVYRSFLPSLLTCAGKLRSLYRTAGEDTQAQQYGRLSRRCI